MAEWHERLRDGDLRHPTLRTRIRDRELLLGTFVKSRDPATTEALAIAGQGLTYLVISTDLGLLRTTAQSQLGQLRTRS
jgi:2-keto-3-deoxy-L-rhamnonate aldolase RhmA